MIPWNFLRDFVGIQIGGKQMIQEPGHFKNYDPGPCVFSQMCLPKHLGRGFYFFFEGGVALR